MHQLPTFLLTTHGSAVQVGEGNCLATRCPGSFSNAIAFCSRPLVVNQKIRIELMTSDECPVAGHLRVGLTTTDPARLKQTDLPVFAYPDLDEREGFWVRTVDKYLGNRPSRCISLRLTTEGTLMFGPDRDARIILLRNLPIDRNVWLLLDIYGRTNAVRIVQPDDVPEEILARGPVCVRSYEAACEAGYQSVYRARLVLFGRDQNGKNCLRSELLNCSIGDKLGLSASSIELSASCSFSLSDRSRWRIAASSEDVFRQDSVNSANGCDDNSNEDTESKNVAIATNITLQILEQKKLQGCHQDTTEDTKTGNCKVSNQTEIIQPDVSDVVDNGTIKDLIEDLLGCNTSLSSNTDATAKDRVRLESLVQESLADAEHYQKAMATHTCLKLPVLRRLSSSSPSQNGRDILFNVLDCSGDEVYFATNQVFMSSRAIYIFVFDLRLDLDAKYRSSSENLIESENACNDDNDNAMSCLEYLDFWLRTIRVHASVAASSQVPPSRSNMADSPSVFIVGTNKDGLHPELKEQQRLVEEKFERIKEMIRGQPYERHVVGRYFAVSGDSDVDSDTEQIEELRYDVEAIARLLPSMGEFIPNRWLNLERAIDRLVASGTNFCSLRQLREVALEEGIRENTEFETMVQFYHELGLIIHFGSFGNNCLSNSVILKPLWLVDVCKSILSPADNAHLLKKPEDEMSWNQFTMNGILTEELLDVLMKKSVDQRPIVVNYMEKLDLIVERSKTAKNSLEKKSGRSFIVPFRFGNCYLPDKILFKPLNQDVTFYYDFRGFLPDALFYKIIVHFYRWSQGFGGSDPRIARRQCRFYFDSEHDFVIVLAPKQYSRIKVVILRVLDLDSAESDDESESGAEGKTNKPPKPHVAAKVRNFLESILCELRETWMKRLSYGAYVKCWCDKPCAAHSEVRCDDEDCLHFLSLDQCLSNKVVYCDHRRCKTSACRKAFPSSRLSVNQRSVAPLDRKLNHHIQGNVKMNIKPAEIPAWVKSAAKLLNGGSDGLDWITLAQKFGYKRNKIESFNYDANPSLSLITDWIISSGNTALSVDMMVNFLEQMHRDDVVDVIQKGQETEVSPPQVFISYEWEIQDEVTVLRDVLERNGLTCWMDIGQMGGGDHLYAKVYEGIKHSKVTIACLTHKYLVSHYCNRELALADLLHKPIIPVLFESMSWPPSAPMSLIFSTLIYVNLKGVGGHGGSGIRADLDAKYQEIVTRVSNYAAPHPKPFVRLSTRSSSGDHSSDESPASGTKTGQQRSSNFYAQSYNMQSELQQSRQQRSFDVRGQTRVQPVHVAKCVMCVLL